MRMMTSRQARFSFPAPPKNFPEKYSRSAMENASRLQCKALRRLEKIRRRKNSGEQWKKQCAEQSEQSENPGEC